MRLAIIIPALALLLAALPARAQTCTVTPPAAFNLGTVDVLANANVDVTGTVNISCTGTANAAARLCLNLGDPNAEAGGIRKAKNAANQISYEIYSDPGRNTRWSSWASGTGAGLEHLFTFTAGGSYTGSVILYARVPAGQMAVVAGNPTLTYTEAFSGVSQLHQRARYISSGTLCPAATTGTRTWGAMTVSVSVPKKCLITGNTLDFGTVTSLAAAVTAQTNLSVTCSNTLAYNIGLDNGLNGTLPTNRRMKQSTNFISYFLYRDAARTLNWGSTIGTDTFSSTGTGSTVSVPVYGRVPVQTTPPPQTYTDSVVVTVTY